MQLVATGLSPAGFATVANPLAPRPSVDDGLTFLDAVMEHLGRQQLPGRLVYAGDSAGGGLALAYAARQRDLGIVPAPSALGAPLTPEARFALDLAGRAIRGD